MIIDTPISPGEFLDKLSILQIKSDRIRNDDKRLNVTYEMIVLTDLGQQIPWTDFVEEKFKELKEVNEELWDVEHEIRQLEKKEDHGISFVGLARAVMRLNGKRTELKRTLNIHLGSELMEEKSY